MDTYFIEFCHQNYDVADITIFKGTEDERDITVADMSLYREIEDYIFFNTPQSEAACRLDDRIACYVEPEDWELDEPEFIEMIEKNFYK